jgi:hypothetical protein
MNASRHFPTCNGTSGPDAAHHLPTGYELICFARKRNFVQQPATDWHDGQITKNLSSPSRKNILLSFSRKSVA